LESKLLSSLFEEANMKPMLAKDAIPEKIKYPVAAQDKIDGIRVVIVDGQALSRTLKPIRNAEIQSALGRTEFNGLDGEIVVGPVTAPDAYRKTASFVMAPNKTSEPWVFYVFDKWDECGSFVERWSLADFIYRESWLREEHIRMLPYTICATEQELEVFETAKVALGHEGIIIRDPQGTYKFGRSYPADGKLLKVKRFIDFEARVVDVYEEMRNDNEALTNALGRTERSSVKANKHGKDTLGGFVVRAINGPAEGVEFKVGTGFSAEDRRELWALWHRKHKPFENAVVKVKSFPIGVKDKPRHPVFLGWRDEEDL
jgi:DNA ligase 1